MLAIGHLLFYVYSAHALHEAEAKHLRVDRIALCGYHERASASGHRVLHLRVDCIALFKRFFMPHHTDEYYMRQAMKLARKGEALGEVPIGCVIVYQDRIIGRGYNRRKTDKSTLSHAELIAIKKADKVIGDWRLEDCTLYVTLEPCQMCAGAIVQARIPRVVMACHNPKAGCAGSILDLFHEPKFNHQVEVTEGVLEQECSEMLSNFFRALRVRLRTESEADD